MAMGAPRPGAVRPGTCRPGAVRPGACRAPAPADWTARLPRSPVRFRDPAAFEKQIGERRKARLSDEPTNLERDVKIPTRRTQPAVPSRALVRSSLLALSSLALVGAVGAQTLVLTPGSGAGSQSASVTGTARQPAPPPLGPKPGPDAAHALGAEQLDDAAGILYLPSGLPELVGWGFTFDPQLGDWVLKQPAASILLDENYVLDSQHVMFTNASTNTSFSKFSSLGVSAAVAYGVVKAAAQFSKSESESSSGFDNSFSLVVANEYRPKMLSLEDAVGLAWLPTAQAVLEIPNPVERALAWKENFGEYVAVGYDVHSHLGVRVTMQQTESASTKNTYLHAEAQYKSLAGGASVNASFSELVKNSMQSEGLTLSVDYEGSKFLDFTIPVLPSSLDDEVEQSEFVNSLYAQLDGSYAKRGLILIPWASIPGVPALEFGSFSGPVLGDAAFVAQHALETLQAAQSWNYPTALRTFLDARLHPQSGLSYGDTLDEARHVIVDALGQLWLDLVGYAIDGDQEASQDLQDSVAAVEAALGWGSSEGLVDVLDDLDHLKNSLPPMTIEVQENFTPDLNQSIQQLWPIHYLVTIKNCGYFSSTDQLIPWLWQYDALTHKGPVVMYEDGPVSSGQQMLTPTSLAAGGLYNPVSWSITPSTASGTEGLFDVKFLIMADDWPGTTWIYVNSTDDLGRDGFLAYNRFWDNPWP